MGPRRLAAIALVAALLWALILLPIVAIAQTISNPTASSTVSGQDAAIRVLRSAATPLTPIATVMASPPTITQGAANANSTIVPGAAVSGTGARYPILSSDTSSKFFSAVGGILQNNRVRNTYQAGSYSTQHAGCIKFATLASAFDISLGSSGGNVAIYVTDATGLRARATADDIVLSAQPQWLKVDFGTRSLRTIENCFSGFVYGINVSSTDSIWPAQSSGMARMAIIGDSYSVPTISLASGETSPNNGVRLGFADYIAAGLGITNPIVSGYSGTGIINNNGTAGYSFSDRANGFGTGGGDLDWQKIGDVDLVYIYNSLNDGAQTDAALYTAAVPFIQRVMIAQPRAIIVFAGFQSSVSFAPAQARYDNTRAACEAARNGDLRVLCLDNGPSGEAWMFGTASTGINSVIIGPDGTHPNKSYGGQYLGDRISKSIIAALRLRYGL